MHHLGIQEENLRVTGADTPGPRLEGDDFAATVSAAHQASPSPGVSGLRLASSARQDESYCFMLLAPCPPTPHLPKQPKSFTLLLPRLLIAQANL